MSPPTTSTNSTAVRKALALQRIDASRTLLIQRLWPSPTAAPSLTAPRQSHSFARPLAVLLGHLARHGLAADTWRTARSLARRWWTRQPWHASLTLVAHTLEQETRPIVRRHPWASLGAAAAVGGALVLARPWIARALRRQTQTLGHTAWQVLCRQLTQAPVQLALAGALSAWISRLAAQADPPPPPEDAP